MNVTIGLIGFGVIGSGVVSLLEQHSQVFANRTGAKIVLGRVVDLDLDRVRAAQLPDSVKVSSDYQDVLGDPAIDIVVELVGGTGVAFDIVSGALDAKKHVVTANKALLSQRGEELYTRVTKNERELRFEASVAGGIPIIKVITESLASDRIDNIYGIVNGTTNFILTRMFEEQWTFDAALRRAQELGFAEADPTLDINGKDAEHKLGILASVAYDTLPPKTGIHREGIESLELTDVLFAKQLGYVIKLLAIAKRSGKELSLRVHPTLIPEKCSLASVKNEFNAVMLESEYLGQSLFVGRGAGARPTATAVVGDVIELATGLLRQRNFSSTRYRAFGDFSVLPPSEIHSRYYLRFATIERAGILAKVTRILGEEDISISAIHQKEGGEPIPIVILTRTAREENLRRAVAAIDREDFTRGKTVVLHVEDIGL